MVRSNISICVAVASIAALVGCSDDDSGRMTTREKAYADAVKFIDEHWSAELLVEGYIPSGDDPERSGEGPIYFPSFEPIGGVGDLDNLPFWVTKEENEVEYMQNAAVWLQFVFGWDDFRRASIPRPEYGYEPRFRFPDLEEPWVSENRLAFKQLLRDAGIELSGE